MFFRIIYHADVLGFPRNYINEAVFNVRERKLRHCFILQRKDKYKF